MLEIYKDFELLYVEPNYSRLMWRRRFGMAGEFQMHTNFTAEKMDIFAQGNIVYKRDVDEAVFVEERRVIQNLYGELIMVVRGRALTSLLDRRVATAEGNYTLSTILTNIINNNFLTGGNNAAARVMPSLRLVPLNIGAVNVSADYKRASAYEAITGLLAENNIGVRCRYNIPDKTYDLEFYGPTETDVVFSREYANIIDQDYYDSVEKFKNVVYVDDKYVHNNDIAGFERREMSVYAPSGSGAAYFRQTAIDALNKNKATKTLSSTVNAYGQQYEYLTDWDIGSVVLSHNAALNYSEREIITEVTEFYDESGMNLEVNLGDYKVRE